MSVSDPLTAAAFAAAVCGVAGLAIPRLVAAIPEPEPEPEAESEQKPPYRELAAGRDFRALAPVLAAVAGAGLGWALGWEHALLIWLPLVPVLVALALVDWHTRLLPTWLIARTYVLLLTLVAAAWLLTRDTDDLVRAGWGWLIFGSLYFVLWFIHPRGLGYGDVRLSGILGIALGYLGWGELVAGLYGGFLLGGALGGVLALAGVVDRKGSPFGPFMVLGAWTGVLLGPWTWSVLA